MVTIVNAVDEFSTRLVELLDYMNIKPVDLAEKMGVQRTSFNHLLSGRNKPGFEFLHRLHTTYPSVNLTWLITGTGTIMVSDDHKFSPVENLEPEAQSEIDLFSNIFNQPVKKEVKENPIPSELPFTPGDEKEIDRLIIVYKSGKMVEIKH